MSTLIMIEIEDDVQGEHEVALFKALDVGIKTAVGSSDRSWVSSRFYTMMDSRVIKSVASLLEHIQRPVKISSKTR